MKRKFSNIQRRAILEEYENTSGITEQKIADILHVSQPTISNAITRARLERRIAESSGGDIVIVGILRDILFH